MELNMIVVLEVQLQVLILINIYMDLLVQKIQRIFANQLMNVQINVIRKDIV